ncbi:MAG TPA: hypothetical protein DIT49_01280 [Clostridiales bacterium]|nr:hypothetical protein [Clostridiales bacterium]
MDKHLFAGEWKGIALHSSIPDGGGVEKGGIRRQRRKWGTGKAFSIKYDTSRQKSRKVGNKVEQKRGKIQQNPLSNGNLCAILEKQ